MKIKKKVLAALTALSLAATCVAPIAALADYDVDDSLEIINDLTTAEEIEIPDVSVTIEEAVAPEM